MEFTGHSGDFVYLSAQNNQEYGDVTCTITISRTRRAGSSDSRAASTAPAEPPPTMMSSNSTGLTAVLEILVAEHVQVAEPQGR
jgi:hypothetical protein